MKPLFSIIAYVISLTVTTVGGLAGDLSEAIATIKNVGPEGMGNAEAANSWKVLTQQDSSAILPILSAMKGSSPLAQNWLRSAVEVVFQKQADAHAPLPTDQVKQFLLETKNDPRARKLAFDLLTKISPDTARSLVPGMVDDPSTALRREAVALLIDKGASQMAASDQSGAEKTLQKALDAARDVDQIKKIAGLLRNKLKQPVNLPEHFGFLMYWKIIAPFDNTDHRGFAMVYPPENRIDLDASYPGKNGTVSWRDYSTSDEYGMVDFNRPFDPLKGVTGYAYTEFDSKEDRPAELRLGCKNGWKIWLNGKFVFGRDEYHRGARIDQYQLPVHLEKGKNTILIKLCQDEQHKPWTVEWQFQLRVCDSTGTAILSTDRKPTPTKAATGRRSQRNR